MDPRYPGRPAWPLLAGAQVLILALLLAAGATLLPGRRGDLDDRLAAVQGSEEALERAIAAAESPRALEPGDEPAAERDLRALAAASGLVCEEIALRPGAARDGRQPVDAWLTLSGDPFDVPVFLAGLRRQDALVHPVRLASASAGGGAQRFRLTVRYYRPSPPDPSWIAPRLAQDAAGSAAAPLLERSLLLAHRRAFLASEPELAAQADAAHQRAARDLAAPLIKLRRGGSRIDWRLEELEGEG